MILPVILCGGTGSRLWPLSRELYPKQLLSLVNHNTMLQDTILRTKGIGASSSVVICNEEHRFLVAEQMRRINVDPEAIILEPFARNTAPAVALAALEAAADGSNPVLLVLPSDHVINDVDSFRQAVEKGRASAETGKLVTFGVLPKKPETGYGYIQVNKEAHISAHSSPDDKTGCGVYEAAAFVEKPDRAAAEQYLASGNYFWNSGMFMFTAERYLEELGRFEPAILEACRVAHAGIKRDKDFLRPSAGSFAMCPANSIDYAVMEKTKDATVIYLDAGWSDVGSWSALWEIGERDEDGNLLRGDVLVHESRNCLISAESRLVSAVGLDDHVIVETSDAVLVSRRDCVQDVKAIVRQLNDLKRQEAVSHRKVYRPWGTYESVDIDERFQVKRITVNPGASLSLQMHHHRAEHWIVVKGTARITKGDEVIILSENQSIYIPLGVTHRLANPGVIPLELIEVQSGSYLGEDDIVRFDDVYGR